MTGTADRVEALANALDQAHSVVVGIRADQASASTPCRSWDVATLTGHVLTDLEQFTRMAKGEDADYTAGPAEVSPDSWPAEFEKRSAALISAWRHAGPNPMIDMQIAELALHAWDLDVATQQSVVLDPVLAEIGLHWMRGMLKDEHRGSEEDGKSFGPEVDIAADAPSYDRFAAFAGRTP